MHYTDRPFCELIQLLSYHSDIWSHIDHTLSRLCIHCTDCLYLCETLIGRAWLWNTVYQVNENRQFCIEILNTLRTKKTYVEQ